MRKIVKPSYIYHQPVILGVEHGIFFTPKITIRKWYGSSRRFVVKIDKIILMHWVD